MFGPLVRGALRIPKACWIASQTHSLMFIAAVDFCLRTVTPSTTILPNKTKFQFKVKPFINLLAGRMSLLLKILFNYT